MNTQTTWATANERARIRHEQHLAAKVAGQNKVNAAANEYEKTLIEAFRPFVGSKILTHNGLAARVKPHIPETKNVFRCWRDASNYSLRYKMDVTMPVGDSGCVYCEASIYVGDLDGYNLKNVSDPQKPRRTDYTVEEIRAKRKALQEARDAMRKIEHELSAFGEYDQ